MPETSFSSSDSSWLEAYLGDGASLPLSFRYGDTTFASASKAWRQDHAADGAAHTWTVADPATGLEVRMEAVLRSDPDSVEWVARLRNAGKSDMPVIEDLLALDVAVPLAGQPVLHYARGAICTMDDFHPIRRVLNEGARVHVQPGGGRSSSEYLPFFNLECGDGTGVVVGIGWSGEWAFDVEREKPDAAHLRAGMARTRFVLRPDEEVRTPRILLIPYRGDHVTGQNVLRRHLLAHHRPMANGKPAEPPVCNGNWGATSAKDHLANIAAIVEHDLPLDTYWIDAAWFGKGEWMQNTGDWRLKADLYPLGFRPISDALHRANKRLLLWFEPERVAPGTPWATEHAGWLLSVPPERRAYNWGASQQEPDWWQWESLRNQINDGDLLFDLGNPEARRFLTDFVAARIEEFGIDCYRHDANIAPLEFWRAADEPDREGITEIRWVEGLYAFWDALLERFPHLTIDNCASGGRRIDLETISRAFPLWRTDFPGDPIGRQCHTHGLASWVPLNGTGSVTLGRDDLYAARSTYSSALCFNLFGNGDAPQAQPAPADFPFDAAASALTEYAVIRHLYLGDFHALSDYTQATDAWVAWQFDRSDLGEGMLQIFRRPNSPHERARYRLKDLDPQAEYMVRSVGQSVGSPLTGRMLMEQGVLVTIAKAPGSAILTYRRMTPAR